MEAFIEKGRHSYGARKYEEALEHFTRAMKLCSCTRGIKRKRCLCKDFEAVAAKGGSIFVEAMYTCACDVGKMFNKCDQPLHIKALDYRAATYEMLQLLGRAEKDASWMLELAPRLPDGYLRLAKVARLRDEADFARNVYDAGVEACKDGAANFPSKFEKLRRSQKLLQQRFKRRDPMRLPLDVAHEIFSKLNVADLARCMRVSIAWKCFLESRLSRCLWRCLVFERSPRKPLSNLDFSRLVARSGGDVREAVIADPDGFHISWNQMTTLLLHCPNIERLIIGGGADEYYHLMPKGHSYPKLRHLSLESHLPWEDSSKVLRSHGLGGVPVDFIKNIAGSLEFLALGAVPPSLCQRTHSPVFTNLKYLRLDDKFLTAEKPPLPVLAVAVKTPNLEQLYLSNCHVDCSRRDLWYDKWHTLWSRLKVFFFSMPIRGWAVQVEASASSVTLVNSLRSGAGLEHLDFDIAGGNAEQNPGGDEIFTVAPNLDKYGIRDADGRSVLRTRQFPDLGSLGFRNFVAVPERMGQILGESVRSGKLHTYDIVFPLPDLEGRTGQECVDYLGGYAWLRGLASIRHLGVSRFCFRELATGDDDMPLPGFIASFPNLETLSISSDYCSVEDFCYIVEATLKATHLKILYQNCAKGAMMDCIEEMAASYGVQHIYGDRPRVWPVPLDS